MGARTLLEIKDSSERLIETNEKNKQNVQIVQAKLNSYSAQAVNAQRAYAEAENNYNRAIAMRNSVANKPSPEGEDNSSEIEYYSRLVLTAENQRKEARNAYKLSMQRVKDAQLEYHNAQSEVKDSSTKLLDSKREIQEKIGYYKASYSDASVLRGMNKGENIVSFMEKLSARKKEATDILNRVLRSLGEQEVSYDSDNIDGNNETDTKRIRKRVKRPLSGGNINEANGAYSLGGYNSNFSDLNLQLSNSTNLSNQDTKEPLISDEDRRNIRNSILNGSMGEKDIRNIGSRLKERFEHLISERNREIEQINHKMELLTKEIKKISIYDRLPFGSDEYKKLCEERNKLIEQKNECDRKYNRITMVDSVLKDFRKIGPSNQFSTQTYFSNGNKEVQKVLDDIRGHLPTDWVETNNSKPIYTLHVDRGYFCNKGRYDEIALSGTRSNMYRCGFHELGHSIEDKNQAINVVLKEFYERRTQGEELQWLGGGYEKTEVARFDNFIDPYMGKDYGGTAYELLSMGLESVYCGSYNLNQDPEYENLIWGIMAAL